jgi:hypothetical protein
MLDSLVIQGHEVEENLTWMYQMPSIVAKKTKRNPPGYY